MQNDMRIDGHKLMLHPKRVADWLNKIDIPPIYMEVSPSGACNHRCVFCGTDFMGYQKRFIPPDLWRWRVSEMGKLGIKAIMFAGEGEPFLHPQMEDIAQSAHDAGIDVAFTTNGSLLTEERVAGILPITSWIKISCNAGEPETYSRIHRAHKQDFFKVLANMEKAASIREKILSRCALGFQMLLLPENIDEAVKLGRRVRDIGCDYLVIKPYSQHPLSRTKKYGDIHYDSFETLENELASLNTEGFKTIVRKDTAAMWNEGRKRYSRCLALPFWCYVDAGCSVWGCSMFMNDDSWNYGNLREQSFAEIWHGEKRRRNLDYARDCLDAGACRVNCRMDKINSYLHELLNPGPHANFI